MEKLDMVHHAVRELGNVPAPELSSFIEKCHGVRIEPRFLPIYLASLRDLQRLESSRQARAATERSQSQVSTG